MAHKKRNRISNEVREQLVEAQNWRCCLCGEKMLSRSEVKEMGLDLSKQTHPLYATFEHIIPAEHISKRTKHTCNLAVSHYQCNEKRNNEEAGFLDFELLRLARIIFPKTLLDAMP